MKTLNKTNYLNYYFLLLTLFPNLVICQNISTVFPKNDYYTADSTVVFEWDYIDNYINYKLEISSNSDFNTIFYNGVLTDNNSDTCSFLNFETYYWRVKGYNLTNDSIVSNIVTLNLFSPKNVSGIQAWFNPDYGISTINNKITQWIDLSGLNRIATQLDTSKSPTLINNSLNHHSVLQFDGINDYLFSDFGQDFYQPNSYILLWNITGATTSFQAPFLGLKGTKLNVYFWLSNSMQMNGGNYVSFIYPKTIPFSYITNTVEFNSSNSRIFENNIYKNTVNAGTSEISSITLGGQAGQPYWLKGNIAELIFFNDTISDLNRLKIEKYLLNKYAPPVNLGPNIKKTYGLCPTILKAENGYKSYLWNTGDTTNQIIINSSGLYWVKTIDIFGVESSDTIEVFITYPQTPTLPDTTICFGDTYQYNWPPISNYTLNWSNGNSGSTFTESQGGSYIAILTDTLGCSYKDTFNLFVDSLALRMSLGNDTSYCSGNTLNYQLNNYTLTNPQFLWSTGSTSATALVDSTHAYWLQITNPRECVARDTVLINVRGEAPVVSFSVLGKCLGETTPFSDLSYTTDGSNLVSWQWNFGDGNNAITQNPTHQYIASGIYPITLTITTDSLCSNSITIPTVIYSLPKAAFSPILGCNNTPIQFNDQSQTFDGYTLNNFTWNFGDTQSGGNNQSNTQNPAHQFDTSGIYLVKLKIESNVGCTDSISKIITIKKAPQANFIYSNTCEGQTTWFSDSTITETWNPITTRLWLFDDGNSSTNISTSKKYDESGHYPVSYIIQTLNGCADTVDKTVSVYNIPTADFTSNSICKNEPVILQSSSIVEDDIISYVRWKIGTNRVYTGSPVQLYIDSAATYPVELIVKTPHECEDTITKNIIIKPIPQSQFTYQYDEQSIGYNIQFINTSIGGSTYEWQGPSGTFSTQQNPVYDFVASGTYPILLVTTNNVSCSDSATSSILVSSPIMDIAVSDLKITSVENYQQAHVNLINISNRNITDLWITLQLNNQQIRERFSGMICPGEITPFHFNTQIFIPNGEKLEFGCVRIESPLFTHETTIDNNQVCITLGEEYSVVKLFPNPANDFIQLWLSSPNESTSNIRILTTKGSEVISWNNQTLLKGITQLKLPLTELSNGLYILEVEFNNKVERMKFNIIR